MKFKLTLFLTFTILIYNGFGENIKINAGKKTELLKVENTNSVLRLNNTVSEFTLTKTTPSFVKMTISGYGHSMRVGEPELPVMKKLIEVPIGASVEVEITNISYKEYNIDELGFQEKINPYRGPIVKSNPNPATIEYKINGKTYFSDRFTGQKLVSTEILGTMRGIRIARLEIAPVQYNPVSNIIRIFDELEITLFFKNADIPLTKNMKKRFFSPFTESIRSKLLNYKPLSPDELITSSPATYVIISDPMFYDALQPFIQWKTKKGFKVITGYTDDPEVGNTTESIKAYLENLYNDPPDGYNPQSFILFVGDVDQVPSFSVETGFHLTDLYYAEYTGDIFPECYYGRFSASSPDELEPQIDKTLEYEMYQFPEPVFLDSTLLIAGVAPGYDTLWGNGQINYMVNNYLNPENGIFSHLYIPPFAGGVNYTDSIIQTFNNGVSFVNYTGHCSMFGFSSPPLNIGHIQNFTNEHRYPLVVGNCCSSASFYMTCFGEEIVRAAGKGALAYIGAANSTYWDEDYWWMVGFKDISSNPQYNGDKLGLIDRWFHTNGEPEEEWYITLGEMPAAGNLAVTQAGSSMETYYWEAYNLLGDPSVMIYIPEPPLPYVTYEPAISPGTDTLTVTTEPRLYAAVSMNGVLHGAAIADENGIANINIFLPFTEPGTADVVVTGQNKQPFFGTVEVMEAQGVYILLQSFEIDDSNGNGDGKADAGENIQLDMTLFNFGDTVSESLMTSISTPDPYITLETFTSNWPPLQPGESNTKEDAYSMNIGEGFENGHIAVFNLLITDGNNIWNSQFSITLHNLVTQLPDIQNQESLSGVKLFPNPSVNGFRISYELGKSVDVVVTMYDILGNQVLTTKPGYPQQAGEYSLAVNTSELKAGIYICKIQAGNSIVAKRVVIR